MRPPYVRRHIIEVAEVIADNVDKSLSSLSSREDRNILAKGYAETIRGRSSSVLESLKLIELYGTYP